MKKSLLGLLFLVFTLNASQVYATFNVEALQSADLAFSSSGIVDRVYVDIGSVVKKGDLLAKLQNDDLKAMLKISQTALKYAKNDYNRQAKIKHLIDEGKFESFEYKYENAKVQVLYNQALLDKSLLRAPFDGVIAAKAVEEGDVVSGQMIRTLMKISSRGKRKLVLEFDQAYWKSVKVGQTFEYKVDGDEKVYSGKISKVYPYVDESSRKRKAEVIVDGFVVGLFGDGNIIIDDKK